MDYEKIRPDRLRPVQMPPPKRDSEESDWNENLYPHSYQAKVQSHIPPKQPLPSWLQGIRKESSSVNKNIVMQVNNPETPVEPMNSKSSQGIIISNAKTISKEAFEVLH